MALPAKINTNGQWEDILAECYECFCNLFYKNPPVFYRGRKLVCDDRRMDSEKEEGFWHITTRGKGENRLFESDRARRMPLIAAMLDESAPGLKTWSYVEGRGHERWYLWLEEERYAVVLQPRKNVVSLVTAFYVTPGWGDEDLRKSMAQGQPLPAK